MFSVAPLKLTGLTHDLDRACLTLATKPLSNFSNTTIIHIMFEDKLTVYLTLIMSTLGSLLNFFMLYGIIMFEKNHHNRTLINQLVASTFWYGIICIFFIQIPITIRYLVSCFPEFLCACDSILRNVIYMQIFFLLDAVLLCRYTFIFHLKNPTAFQEDFWKLFINLITITFSMISQVTLFLLPGKQPNMYYVCLGEFPNKYIGLPTKPNIPEIFLFLFTVVFYAYASIQIKTYSKSQNYPNLLFQTGLVPAEQACINMQSLENIVVYIIDIWVLLSVFMVIVVLNRLNLDEIDQYPNYFWFYAMHHLVPFSATFTMMAIHYGNNMMLRKFLKTEYF